MIDFYTIDIFTIFIGTIFALQVLLTALSSDRRYKGMRYFVLSFLGLAFVGALGILSGTFSNLGLWALYMAVVTGIYLSYLSGWYQFSGDSPGRLFKRILPVLAVLYVVTLITDWEIIYLNLVNSGILLLLFIHLRRKSRENNPCVSPLILYLNGVAFSVALFLFFSNIAFQFTDGYMAVFDHIEALNVPLQFSIFIISITLGIMNQRRYRDRQTLEEKENLTRELEALAHSDSLTGISNRRGFESILSYEFEQLKRGSGGYSVILGDIDFFKRVNDAWGHDCGDLVIREAAGVIGDCIRSQDSLARWGGEEFIILLKSSDSDENLAAAERIRESLEKRVLDFNGEELRFTMSFGLATARPDDPDAEAAVIRADRMLYRAKKTGRNKVVLYNHKEAEG
jgi:diguanylate cyclase (GGDEF)-like protein